MQTIDESYEDLWSDLESDFEQGEAQPLPLDLPDPPSRQRTVNVANLQSVFSGFYPTLVLCLAAGLVGLGDLRETLVLGAVCFLAFPLAVILSPTMRGAKRGWWYYSLTALLVGGVGELVVALSDGLLRFSLSHHFSQSRFISALQHQMESFFSLQHWLLYLLLGAGVAHITQRIQSRKPWMDSPRTGRLHMLVATGLLAVPLLLPLSCFILGRVFWQQSDWLVRTQHLNPHIQRTPYSKSKQYKAWDELYHASRNMGETPLPMLHKIEATYLELAGSGRPPGDSSGILQIMLRNRRAELNEPFRVARVMVSQSTESQLSGELELHLTELWEFLLESLPARQLSLSEGQSLLKKIQTYDERALNPKGDADRLMLALALSFSPYSYEGQMPMTLFGVSFERSPKQLYFLYYSRFATQGWLDLKETLPFDNEEQQLEIIKQQADSDGFLQWVAIKPYDYELRPLWRAAAVLTASKLHKLETGSWPKQLSDVKSLLWFEANFSLTELPDGLQIQDNSSNQIWVLR